MTDITDQDRRLALRWCDMLGDSALHKEAAATRRVILATVDAPAPTLAEELRSWAEDASYDEDRDNLLHAAARAEQMEHGIAEARAEVERLTAVQKGAESNAESIDPADVPPGEAWIVECRGERRAAVKDNDYSVPWCTVNADGWFNAEKNEDVTLITRLVPAPRVITNPEELRALLTGAAIEHDGTAWLRRHIDSHLDFETTNRYGKAVDLVPATVLWEPGA